MEGGKLGLGRKGQGAWGPVPGCVVLDATRRSPSDPGRSPQGQQSRSKLSTVQIRCSAIDFSAHIAGWLYPAKHFSVSLGRRTALWHFAGRQGLGGLAFGDVLMASEEKNLSVLGGHFGCVLPGRGGTEGLQIPRCSSAHWHHRSLQPGRRLPSRENCYSG